MLSEFQQAFVDMVASPEMCLAVRRDPAAGVLARYELTDRERRRLIALARHPGMAMNCMLYRANRLAPLALNMPRLCKALGDDLRPLASAYWQAYPTTDVHFLIESQRFCDFVYEKMLNGYDLPREAREALDDEARALAMRLEASQTEA
jgi:hypothetical protein